VTRASTYALLTDKGYEKLREASSTHVDGIRSHFAERFSTEELETLARLLSRLPLDEVEGEDCAA
jgi:hypothetical protein